jgi:two-component system response regulator YesN
LKVYIYLDRPYYLHCFKIIADNQKDINQIFVLFYDSDEHRLKKSSHSYIRNAYSKIQSCLNISITIGVSDVQDKLTYEIYKQSKLAFEQRLVLGNNQIHFFERVMGYSGLSIPHHKIKLLQRCMEISDLNGIQSILNDIFLSDEASDMAGVYIRLVYFEVINRLLKVCSNYGICNLTDSEFLSGEIIDYMENSLQIAEYLYTMIGDILTGKSTENVDCKKLIEDIEAYIRNNYSSEITVGELAKKYSINPDYLSTIFKQETGKNIIKYLTEIRIDNACQLLKETQAKVSDIAFSSGYKDRQYFNRVFKKITGMTPIEYRNMKKSLS